ncbi:beta-lactamase-like protein [Hypoxylon sp. NC1633]|nr:beta-lactamase-like protein [Hypoxylon sp. NC1633]
MAKTPDLKIPPSTSTVNVSIVNTEASIRGLSTSQFFEPKIPGHDHLAAPVYSFLIQHPVLNRTVVFDLGIKKDYWNVSPAFVEMAKGLNVAIDVPKGIREILDAGGVDTKNIEAVIWSHSHFDHVGDPSTFEPSTTLVVGPGVKKNVLPGYPTNPEAVFLETDTAGREVQELDFTSSGLKIGRFPALDYFGDGSFYLLDCPGHCVGHVCGFARVSSNPDSYILMGGDVIHHDGELRPHHWHPLPNTIAPHPFNPTSSSPCPGDIFEKYLHQGKAEPFYVPVGGGAHFDVPEAIESIKKLQELDAHENILVVPAHDQFMLGVVDFFPKPANDFLRKGWAKDARWKFLGDFAKAVGHEGKVETIGDYSLPDAAA